MCVYNARNTGRYSSFQWRETHFEMKIFGFFSITRSVEEGKRWKTKGKNFKKKIMTKAIRLHANVSNIHGLKWYTVALNQYHMAIRAYTFDSISIQTNYFEYLTRWESANWLNNNKKDCYKKELVRSFLNASRFTK